MSPYIPFATVNAIDSGATLHISRLGGDTVRITRVYHDSFDGDFDHEVLEGDFLIGDLQAALAAVSAPVTGAVPVQKSSRPGRRKPKWWVSR